ncbi:MAG: ABC transporter substrate-binding protein [Acidimicrobiia bacterium]|nr:ABC transporter substrate-binding protein [Acidimicrobiia bacterium]
MTLRVGLPDLISPSYFPAIAAVELGFFERAGLDAEIEVVFPVSQTYQDLADGRLQLAAGSAHAALYQFEEWTGCRLACALSQNMYWFLVVRRDLKPVRGDLGVVKGLRIAAAPGPIDGLRRMLQKAGVDPDRDLSIVPPPGSGSSISFGVTAAKALESGAVDGFWANGMGAQVALEGGYGSVVVDARRDDDPPGAADYTFPALVATESMIEDAPDVVERAVHAVVGAQDALKEDPARARTAASHHFPSQELDLILSLIERDSPFYDPVISPQKVESMNRFAGEIGILSDVHIPYERVVATRFEAAWRG